MKTILFIVMLMLSPLAAGQTSPNQEVIDRLRKEVSDLRANNAIIMAEKGELATSAINLRKWGEEKEKAVAVAVGEAKKEKARADKAESTWGYIIGKWVKRTFWLLIIVYALYIILRVIALNPATGSAGAVISWVTGFAGGWLPGAGILELIFSNLWHRVGKEQAQTLAAAKLNP